MTASELPRISRLEAYARMKLSKGKTFTVDFVKKDNTIRKMNCKTNIKKLIKGDEGKGLQYNPLDKLLMPVVDLQELVRLRKAGDNEYRAWRSINLQTVIHLKIDGKEFIVT